MRARRLRSVLGALVLPPLCVGCAPKFQSAGSLSIDGAPFEATACHTLASGGIELLDGAGSRLALTLSPGRLDAFQEIHGTPDAAFQQRGQQALGLGPCGSLALRGEGYHAENRRAASGRAVLSCTGGAVVSGELTITGCF